MKISKRMKNSYPAMMDSSFRCLVENGLEHSSVRDFCKAAHLSSSSFYYRFTGKQELVLEATYYGLRSITNELFLVAVKNLDSINRLFDCFFDTTDRLKKDIKLIYQVANSPVYGDELKRMAESLNQFYHEITELIAQKLNCSPETLFPYVTLFISAIREYVIWEDRTITQGNLQLLYDGAMQLPKKDAGVLTDKV